MNRLYPLRFHPILRYYIWGGEKLASQLGKPVPAGQTCAESWEICDRGTDQSVVAHGPLAGVTLGELVRQRPVELFGRHAPPDRFPLLLKFLDARHTLSVQVHPDDAQAALLDPPDLGKTEAWIVLDAEPDAVIYAGLLPGVDPETLAQAIEEGNCQRCLHRFRPRAGDCVFLPAGTVHALGGGLLVAEIQQSSDTTYRLFDWNRVGADGRPRPLHIREGLAAIDFGRGPVDPCQPRPTSHPLASRLVACDQFVLDRWSFGQPSEVQVGGDNRFHVLAVLAGAATITGTEGGDAAPIALRRGASLLLPASIGAVSIRAESGTSLMDAYLP